MAVVLALAILAAAPFITAASAAQALASALAQAVLIAGLADLIADLVSIVDLLEIADLEAAGLSAHVALDDAALVASTVGL